MGKANEVKKRPLRVAAGTAVIAGLFESSIVLGFASVKSLGQVLFLIVTFVVSSSFVAFVLTYLYLKIKSDRKV